jgi:hypothetical protein
MVVDDIRYDREFVSSRVCTVCQSDTRSAEPSVTVERGQDLTQSISLLPHVHVRKRGYELRISSRDTTFSTPPIGSMFAQNLLRCLAPLQEHISRCLITAHTGTLACHIAK